MLYLKAGDCNSQNSIKILDEDKLCYSVLSSNHGATGIRTISKKLLEEYVEYEAANPHSSAQTARDVLTGLTDIDKFEYGYSSTLWAMAKLNKELSKERTGQGGTKRPLLLDEPLQQIFYGAPGTGKSFQVDDKCKKYRHHRTTFHPDSDYSTFVGCYKPTKQESVSLQSICSKTELGNLLKEIKDSGVSYPYHKFAYKYWNSVKQLSIQDKKDVLKQCGASENYTVEFDKAVALAEEYSGKNSSDSITYTFVHQAFTDAYIEAWKNPTEPVFLVVEEINRGNCAQIFGDLFQLLDRDDETGMSAYEISPDADLKNYIAGEGLEVSGVLDSNKQDISAKIMSGELMKLPSNLYIWATMNTSDQSLFPIDSAFKRRWDWKYVPINTRKENWNIEVNGQLYSWSTFLDKINYEIEDTTSSEDKKLGFYFCKAKDNVIKADKFVSKVWFYLYNDVFSDYGLERQFFKHKDGDQKDKKISFHSLYNMDGSINETIVAELLNNLGVKPVALSGTANDEDDEEDYETGEGKDRTRYTINGVGDFPKRQLSAKAVEKFIELHPNLTPEQVVNEWMSLGNIVSHFIETQDQFDSRTDNSKRSHEVKCGDSQIYVAWNGWGKPSKMQTLIDAVNNKDWGIQLAAKE